MKKQKNYWIDENNNKWDCSYYTEDQAIKNSKSLINCFNCLNCISCISCISCRSCIDCISCSDFKSNPERITSKRIGSRNSQTTYYWNEEKEQIVCGCFTGTLQEFKEAVKKEHNENDHAKDYLKWIAAVECYKSLI